MGLIPQLKITGLSDPGNIATLNKWADGVRVELNNLANTANVAATGASQAMAATGNIPAVVGANTVNAGPAAGPGGPPIFRLLVSGDIPNLDASKITTGELSVSRGGTGANLSLTGGPHEVVQQSTVGGNFTVGQLSFADISGNLTLSQLPVAGVTAGPFTTITSITVTNGLVTALTGF